MLLLVNVIAYDEIAAGLLLASAAFLFKEDLHRAVALIAYSVYNAYNICMSVLVFATVDQAFPWWVFFQHAVISTTGGYYAFVLTKQFLVQKADATKAKEK